MYKVHPYLNFDGTCEEAFGFYQAIFGGTVSSLMRFKDMPPSAGTFAPQEAERIMHMALPLGNGIELMGSDISPTMGQKLIRGTAQYIMLAPDNRKEAERLFEGLSAGGRIEMALQKSFWGDWFASFTDRYGIQWMIDSPDK
jgi:PhnB protein